jgi:hypothetical protein
MAVRAFAIASARRMCSEVFPQQLAFGRAGAHERRAIEREARACTRADRFEFARLAKSFAVLPRVDCRRPFVSIQL